MKILDVPDNRMIKLPKRLFKAADKIALINEGSVLLIKKVEGPRVSAIAERARGRAPSMRDIVREVHAYRRAKSSR